MSALSETKATSIGAPEGIQLLLAEVEPWIARIFYTWADAHQHDVIVKKKILFISITITVGDLETLFGLLVGPRP